VALGPLGRTEAAVGPGTVEVSASPARSGATVVALPPLGRLSAATHGAPVELTARVLAIDIEAAQRSTQGVDPVAGVRADVEAALPDVLRAFALRSLAAAALVGGVVALAVLRRHWWYAVAGAAGGVLAVGSLLVATWVPYDIDAFEEPHLSGELRRVPGLLVAAERNLSGLDEVRDRVAVLSSRLAELYAASVGELPGGAPGEVAILHVSDLHLNPLGAELVVRLAEDLDVDAVLDTGDVTTFGFGVEAHFGALLEQTAVPYLLVPGNHDAPANRAQLGALEGITVLDGDVATVGGVRILGIADPTFTASNEVSTAEANRIKADLADEVRQAVLDARPDLLAVHDPAQAARSTGVVRAVAAGHVHERTMERIDGTWVMTIGSTGATGLGSFTVDTDQPYEAEVLRFQDGELVAVDHLRVEGIDGAFTLERRIIEDAGLDAPSGDDVPRHMAPSTTQLTAP
jgi:Icc-related predicted phosphoesterase